MPERKPRKDAARNREAVLAAADTLFARHESPEDVTMADVAAAAGVGKATLFRAFGDRAGLLRALYEARLEPIRDAVEAGPPPLGPAAPPHRRALALLDAVLCFKLDNRRLALALEDSGSSSPYQAGALCAVARPAPSRTGSDPRPARQRLHRPRPARHHPSRPHRATGRTRAHTAGNDAGAAGKLRHQSPGLPASCRGDRRALIKKQTTSNGRDYEAPDGRLAMNSRSRAATASGCSSGM